MTSFFVTGTGTDIGKTVLGCALARAALARGTPLAALKPIETGCDPEPTDAIALAEACGQPDLAHLEGFYRARPPLAPYAVTLLGRQALDYERVLAATRAQLGAGPTLVEGAGGLLVPLDAERTMRELALDLGLPVVLVARDGLGVLSHVLTAMEGARDLDVRAVVLSRFGLAEASHAHNQAILQERLTAPVFVFEDRLEPPTELLDLLIG